MALLLANVVPVVVALDVTEARHVPDSGAVGPRQEQTDDHMVEGFAAAVGSLSDGTLLMPALYGLAASSALARNVESGTLADATFLVDMLRRFHYRVHITMLSPDQPELGEREIINTVAHGLNPLVGLLESLLDEIDDLPERKS